MGTAHALDFVTVDRHQFAQSIDARRRRRRHAGFDHLGQCNVTLKETFELDAANELSDLTICPVEEA